MGREAPTNLWLQTSVRMTDPTDAERICAEFLGPQMRSAVDDGIIEGWFFIRKSPWWRLRYAPNRHARPQRARSRVSDILTGLQTEAGIGEFLDQVYEPETTAFGGATAIGLAHRLFNSDTGRIAEYLTLVSRSPGADRRRELSLLLCTALARAAGQEWYEQGDIWAQVAALRGSAPVIPPRPDSAAQTVRRFLTADPEAASARLDGDLAGLASSWLAEFCTAGTTLKSLADHGKLARGLRAVLAHHVLFHWNRLGLPLADQHRLARSARDAVFAGHHPIRTCCAAPHEGT